MLHPSWFLTETSNNARAVYSFLPNFAPNHPDHPQGAWKEGLVDAP